MKRSTRDALIERAIALNELRAQSQRNGDQREIAKRLADEIGHENQLELDRLRDAEETWDASKHGAWGE